MRAREQQMEDKTLQIANIQKDEEFHRKMTAMTTGMTEQGCLELITPKHTRTPKELCWRGF